MNTTSPVSTNNKLNRTRPLGRLMTILITGLGIVAVLFVLGWVGRKGLVKIISDLADRPFASGDFASAAQRYSWSLQLDTQHLHSRVNRALAYRGLNQKELAAADFLTCAKTQPRSDAEYSLRAECYLQLSQPREALADLNHELAAHPDDADGFAMRARALALLKQWHPAIADVTQALAVQPGRADFALQRSELRERVGDVTGALEDALLSAKLQPTPAAFVQQAKLLRAQKNLSAAEAAYTQALQQQPNNAAALLERAQLRLAWGF